MAVPRTDAAAAPLAPPALSPAEAERALVLAAQAGETQAFAGLVRLPELFPFRFALSVEDLRRSPRFEVHRQGLGWDMVRLAPASVNIVDG